MPESRDYQSVVEEAEASANAGDFARAEALLREALGLQEHTLGPTHVDLASTLNNLAVVCETTGNLADAERFYRRAYAVASASLPADDALVTTALGNLRDFCQAQGLPLALTPAAPPRAAAAQPVSAPAPVAPAQAAVAPTTPPSAPSKVASAPPAPARPAAPAAPVATTARPATTASAAVPRGFIAALVVVALVATGLVARFWLLPSAPSTMNAPVASGPADRPTPAEPTSTPAPTPPSAPVATAPAATTAPATAPTAASVPTPAPARSADAASPAVAAPAPAAPPPAAPARAADAPSTDGVRVATASVCASLATSGAWTCTPLDSPTSARSASYFTRLITPRPLRVTHRWSLNGQVRQSVALSVGAGGAPGYRTFSRQTLTPGTWRVELLAADGAVLHESTFEVR